MSLLAGNCPGRPICKREFVPLYPSMCMYSKCVFVCKRESPTWPSCYRGDKQSKRDVLAEVETIVLRAKKSPFDWLNTGNQEVSSNIEH